ncbi:hypothetical protein [Spirillospora sp. CA-294931]|uniref:hypothetical protein n=1 Tax=Spirillospora sp. CA-294931 TaxID=3240042 RepID=UPI003D8E2675
MPDQGHGVPVVAVARRRMAGSATSRCATEGLRLAWPFDSVGAMEERTSWRTPARKLITTAAVVIGWGSTVILCFPAAWYLGIIVSGWEEPSPHIINGADRNPLYSGAAFMMIVSLVVLLTLSTVLWVRLIRWIIARGRR